MVEGKCTSAVSIYVITVAFIGFIYKTPGLEKGDSVAQAAPDPSPVAA
jgi:hypothetical protein